MMLSTGVDCRACHRVREVSPTGTVWKASADVCITCHSQALADELDAYRQEVDASLADIEVSLQRVRTAIDETDLQPARYNALKEDMAEIEHDVEFLNIGQGIHNIHYASTLAEVLVGKLTKLCNDLEIPPPRITLPETIEQIDQQTELE